MSVWLAIEESIQAAGNSDFSLQQQRVVTGGDISEACLVSDNQQKFFVKLNSVTFLDNFQQEALGLSYLAQCQQFDTPKVVAIGCYLQQSFLILDYLNLNQLGSDKLFAKSLAGLHQITNQKFGFEANNYIGANRQINGWSSDWGMYFVDYRLNPQFEWLFQKNSNLPEFNQLVANSKDLMSKCRVFLNQHSPQPSLVHGDLWQGNYAYNPDGKPAIYDPACYFADREVDIAMLELFGSPSVEFYSVYHQIHPCKSGAKLRKKIYNLYHLLNHANLFGASYFSRVKASSDEILKSL